MIGYSSHGTWDTLGNIKRLEVDERGNEWFDDAGLDPNKTKAIWVTKDPKVALLYLFPSEFREYENPEKMDLEEIQEELQYEFLEFLKARKNPLKYVAQVDLTDAREVLTDGDGGFLFIKEKKPRKSSGGAEDVPPIVDNFGVPNGWWGFPYGGYDVYQGKNPMEMDNDTRNAMFSSKKSPEFFFHKAGVSEWQQSYKGSDENIVTIGEQRSGHAYTNLPHRIKYYCEKFGTPDFIHVIQFDYSPALKAVYAESGKDMVKIWSFVNTKQEPGWREFEKQAKQAGYKIQSYHNGQISDSNGFWLDSEKKKTEALAPDPGYGSGNQGLHNEPDTYRFGVHPMDNPENPGNFIDFKTPQDDWNPIAEHPQQSLFDNYGFKPDMWSDGPDDPARLAHDKWALSKDERAQNKTYYDQMPEGDLKDFYHLCDRPGWEEEQRKEAEAQWNMMSDQEKKEEYPQLRSCGYEDLDPKYFNKKSPEEKMQTLKDYYIIEYVREAEENEVTSTETYFQEPSIGKNVTLVRFTDVPPDQFKGFHEGYGPNNLGLTMHYPPSRTGTLLFAFAQKDLKTTEDFKHAQDNYGEYAYSFKVPWAVRAYHIHDGEYQCVFDFETVKDLRAVRLNPKLDKTSKKAGAGIGWYAWQTDPIYQDGHPMDFPGVQVYNPGMPLNPKGVPFEDGRDAQELTPHHPIRSSVEYPLAGQEIEGLRITDDIPNTGSISASLYDYEILDGIREIPYSEFGDPDKTFYSKNEDERCKILAEKIRENKWIDPLIVVVDQKGPYILEGGHRFVALHLLGLKSLPALVVRDLDKVKENVSVAIAQNSVLASLDTITEPETFEFEIVTAAQEPQWLTQPSVWNGKSQLKSAIMLGGKTYQVNDSIDKWVLKYQNFPDPDKKQAIVDAGDLTPEYFEEFRPIIVDDLNFTLYDWTQPGEDAFQDLVLKVLLNRKPLPQSFSYTLKNPAKNKSVQVVDFMKRGKLALSVIVEADSKPFHVTDEKIFLDTVKHKMNQRLKTLNMMVRNFNRTGDPAQIFNPIFKQIEKQAKSHYSPDFSLREILLYLYNETGVRIIAAPKMAYPSDNAQFEKAFKNWTWEFQKDIAGMARKHPWFDPSILAGMVGEYQDNCKELFPEATVTSKLDVKFHTVMIEAEDCQPDLMEEFAAIQKIIPQEAVYEKHPYQTEFPDGREQKPHTTVFYGIKNGDDMDPIREHCSQLDPISFKIGNISVFRNDNKPYDVLKVEVISPQMKELHYWIKDNFDNVCEFDFNGHLTLAYIQKDTCADLEGPCDWTGAEYTCDVLDFSHAQDGHFKLPLKPEKITGEVSPTDKKEYGGVWTLKNSTNLLKFQKMQKTISELMVSTSSGFSLNTLKEFFISNLKIASQEIHQYFLQHKLPDTEKKRLLQILESGQTQYLKITSEVKIDKTGQHSFRVVFKETEGFVDSPLNFRLEFEAYCYPEFSSYLTLTFLRIGPRKEFYKTESATNDVSGIWYHGRKAASEEFDPQHVGKGNDQEGPGFYLSRDAEDALRYAGPGGRFLEVEVTTRKLASNKNKAKRADIQALIERCPDLPDRLTDWDMDPDKALEKAVDATLKSNDTEKDAFQQVWIDFFRYQPAAYLEALIAMGYDGHLASRPETPHLIMYNPNKINVVKTVETVVQTKSQMIAEILEEVRKGTP